jgi:hypothetical protein
MDSMVAAAMPKMGVAGDRTRSQLSELPPLITFSCKPPKGHVPSENLPGEFTFSQLGAFGRMGDMDDLNNMHAALIPVKNEVKNLLTMFDFYITQRQLGKPIETLNEAVRDMRLIIGRLLIDHFLTLTPEDGDNFCRALATMLADRCEQLPEEKEVEAEYCSYCVGEILTVFEYAIEIKKEFDDDPILQKMLSLDIPILRPFDYGLRGTLKVVETHKKRMVHK